MHTSHFSLLTTLLFASLLCISACQRKSHEARVSAAESREAKALLQGVWMEALSEEVSFKAEGDTIYYPDAAAQPAYFRIIDDTLCLGSDRYHIEKQSAHLFWFTNQNGDLVKLEKTDDPLYSQAFNRKKPEILTTHSVTKTDSVVMFGGERYHWYIAVNPTKWSVKKTSYTGDGVAVDNVYYDNIIHVSVFKGGTQLFSRDFRKRNYAAQIPARFLEKAILGNMQYDGVSTEGFRFNATLCIPDGESCYMVGMTIGFDGRLTMKLLEY